MRSSVAPPAPATPARAEHVDRELAEAAVEGRPEQLVDRRRGLIGARAPSRQRAQRVEAHDAQRDPRVGEALAHDRVRPRAPFALRERGDLAAARSRSASCWPSVDAPRSNASVPIATRQPSSTSPTTFSAARARAVEERLVELAVAGDLHDRPDLDARLVHRHEQVREPLVLRRVAVGAAQHEDPLRPVRERRPHLLAVITHSSPSRTARVCTFARSEPASGSE